MFCELARAQWEGMCYTRFTTGHLLIQTRLLKEWETAVGKVVGETTNRDKILQKFKQQWPAFEETVHEIISSMQDDDGTGGGGSGTGGGGGGSGGVGSAIVNTRSKKYLIINWTLI